MSNTCIKHIVLFFLVGFVSSLSSCIEGVNVANKGEYNDYNVGMYINGVEYHEKIRSLFSPPVRCGFSASTRANSNLIFIQGAYSDLGTNNKAEFNNTYGFCISMCVDSAQYNPTTKYHFSQSTLSDLDLQNIFQSDSLERLDSSIVIGDLEDQDYVVYTIKDGWILLGDNSLIVDDGWYIYYGFKCAYFEFYAESEDGIGISVTDGFCKYFQ
jgi:hypothetical protein